MSSRAGGLVCYQLVASCIMNSLLVHLEQSVLIVHHSYGMQCHLAVSFSNPCYTIQQYRLFSPKNLNLCRYTWQFPVPLQMHTGPWAKTVVWMGLPFLEAGLIRAIFPSTFIICTTRAYSGCFYHSKHIVSALVGLWESGKIDLPGLPVFWLLIPTPQGLYPLGLLDFSTCFAVME